MPLKFRDIIARIEADGWVMVAQEGSHRQYKHPVKKGRVTIPGHPGKDVHPKLEKSIFQQAQIERKGK